MTALLSGNHHTGDPQGIAEGDFEAEGKEERGKFVREDGTDPSGMNNLRSRVSEEGGKES